MTGVPMHMPEFEELYHDFRHEVADFAATVDRERDPLEVLRERSRMHCAELVLCADICENLPTVLARGLITNVRFNEMITFLDRAPCDEVPSWEAYRGHVDAVRDTHAGNLIRICMERKHLHEALSIALLLILWYERDQLEKTQ